MKKTSKPIAKKASGKTRAAVKPKPKVVVKLAKPKAIRKSKPPVKSVSKTKAIPPKQQAAKPLIKSKPSTQKQSVKPMSKPISKTSPAQESGRNRLNKAELKYFENLLNDKKETLLQELGYLEDNTMRLNSKEGVGDLSSHAYHLADHATETQDREQAFHMASREGKFLFYIEEALDRVRAGTFGICKKCGKLIPKARLEAVPTAKMCIDCKSAQEQAGAENGGG